MTNSKKWYWRIIISTLIPASLYAFVVAPLYTILASDVAYQDTIWVTLLIQCTYLLDVVRYWLSFAILISAHYLFSGKICAGLYGIAIAGNFYEHFANLIMDYARNGIDLDEVVTDLLMVLFYTAFESLMLLVLFLVWRAVMYRQKRREKAIKKAAKYYAEWQDVDCSIFPFQHFLSWENPLQCASFWACVAMSVQLIISALIYDIFLGLPTDLGEWLQVIWVYVSLLLTIGLGYLIVTKMISLFLRKNTEKTIEKVDV